MVSGSLCLTSFIIDEFKVSLVGSGQRPRRGQCPLIQRKWATKRHHGGSLGSGEATRVLIRAGWAPVYGDTIGNACMQ